MPNSDDHRHPSVGAHHVATPEIAVNEYRRRAQTPAAEVALPRYTPHHFLILRLARGAPELSAKSRTVLAVMLWCAHKRGEGQGVKPHEAMFWRRQGELAGLCGTYRENVQRSLREMGPAGLRLVRWKKVHWGELLPSGTKAAEAVCVYFVDLDRLKAVLGIARGVLSHVQNSMERSVQDGDTVSPSMETKWEKAPANFPMDLGSPIDPMISDLVNHGEPSSIRPPTPDDDFVGDDPRAETTGVAVAYWLDRIGRRYLAGRPSDRNRTVGAVRTAVRVLVDRGLSLEDLRLIVDARCDRELGGAAFDWCEDPPRKQGRSSGPIWNAGIFGGCADHLLKEARSRAPVAASKPPPSHRTDPSRADPGDAVGVVAMTPEKARSVAARLESLLGVKVNPLEPPAAVAAFRPKR